MRGDRVGLAHVGAVIDDLDLVLRRRARARIFSISLASPKPLSMMSAPACGERLGDAEADAAGRAGDDGGFARRANARPRLPISRVDMVTMMCAPDGVTLARNAFACRRTVLKADRNIHAGEGCPRGAELICCRPISAFYGHHLAVRNDKKLRQGPPDRRANMTKLSEMSAPFWISLVGLMLVACG